MICTLCGKKMKFMDYEPSFQYSFEDELKRFDAYTLNKVLGDGNYCPACKENYNFLKKGTDVEKGYTYFKEVIESNRAHVNINLQNFNKLVEHYYRYHTVGRKEREENKILIAQIEGHIRREQAVIRGRNAGRLVFPKLLEHKHFCAVRQGDNLVMYENFNPEVRYGDNAQRTKYIFEDIKKKGNEKLFMITTIPLENILSYQLIGRVEHTTITSGGGGGGGQPNIRGAVIGGLLFGGAGAVVGSQTGVYINPIKSEIVEHDSRVTILNLKNDKGQAEIRELPYYYSEVFMKVIPEKEFSFIQAQNNAETLAQGQKQNTQVQIQEHNAPAQIQAQNAPVRNMVEEIKQLKELLDLDLITQEEFDAKKKQILNL